MSPTPSERVLIVEDEPSTRVGLTELVRTWGFTADSAGDGEEALQRITVFRPSIIISDLVMPRRDGLELLRALKDDGGDYTVVILTAQGTVETAVEAMKEGAYDYLTKPIEPQRLKILLDKIVERQDTLREVKVLRKQLREHGTYGKMIGSSPQMRKVYQVIEQAAPTSASVLISGESGTGKELVAQTIHQLSPRAQMPFVPINCAAIPETLLESEIFGHEKGFVHRRGRPARRLLRAGRSRDAVSRRDRRDDAVHAGEAAARASGAEVPPAGRTQRRDRGRSRDRGDQRESGRRREERQAA